MHREFIATAATVEEAIDLARQELGISDDIGEVDVLEFPEKKKLGLFGGKDAKVRVSYDDGKPEPKPAKAAKKPAEKAEKAEKPQKSDEKPAKKQKPAEKAAKAPEKAKKPAEPVAVNEELKTQTVQYVRDVLSKMDCGEYTLEVEDVEGGFAIKLTGDGLGVVIGRRGEALDALQYLVSLRYNNSESGFVRVVLDANDYRAKRAVTLQGLARKVAEQVIDEGRNQSLEPMNPYERRVIHTAIQEIEGVTSWSVSDGQDRRVIIGLAKEDGTPVDPDDNPMRRAPRGRGGRGGRDDCRRGGRGGRRESNRYESSAPLREKHSDAGDLPLFGRIDK